MRRLRGEDGVFAILYAALTLAMFGMAAIVVDLGQLRADKRDSRSAADAAALAGTAGLGLGPYAPLQACKTALAYTISNLSLGTPTAAITPADPCAGSFMSSVASCPATPSSAVGTVPSRELTVTVTWPVPATSALLTQPDGKPGPSPRPSDPVFDGSAAGCDRLAVAVDRTRQFSLAAAIGATSGATNARSVARTTFRSGGDDLFYPLVILDPISCGALNVTGGTKVLVKNKNDIPGRIGVDSNGSATSGAGNSVSCSPGSALIVDADGTNGRIEAMPGNLGAPPAIEIFGPDTMPTKAFESGDVACGGTPPSLPPCIKPTPVVSNQQITRKPFDRIYNCQVTVCVDGSNEKAYIDRFRTAAVAMNATSAAAAGWTVISGSLCGSPPVAGADPLRYFVDCNPYKVNGPYVFPPGSTVIINGDLVVENAGCLVVNGDAAPCTTATPSPSGYLTTNGLLSVRGDVGSSGAGPQLHLLQTFLHQPIPTKRFDGGFGGVLSWSAPYVEPVSGNAACLDGSTDPIPPVACFRNLAFWTETPSGESNPAVITGGGRLRLEGTYFMGNAKLRLSGGSSIDVENAQFVAKRIEAFGGSLLTFIPNADRTNPIPRRGVALVR